MVAIFCGSAIPMLQVVQVIILISIFVLALPFA
ncbi:MAG: hypothetical protein ACJAUT_000547 [Cellvibrionaceae bacterium]|jgi:hypothetical protein